MLRHDLALALGCTVSELDGRMTYSELLAWADYRTIKPFGFERDNLLNAINCATIANANRSSKSPPAKAEIFLVKTKAQEQKNNVSNFIKLLSQGSVNG